MTYSTCRPAFLSDVNVWCCEIYVSVIIIDDIIREDCCDAINLVCSPQSPQLNIYIYNYFSVTNEELQGSLNESV